MNGLECIHEWIAVKSTNDNGLKRLWDKDEDTQDVGTLYGVPIKSNNDAPKDTLLVDGKLDKPFKFCLKCEVVKEL